MNQTLEHTQNDTQVQDAATEGKRGRAGRGASRPAQSADSHNYSNPRSGLGGTDSSVATADIGARDHIGVEASLLGAHPQAKFVLFAIRPEERVAAGPVMRGFVELPAAAGAEPVKINVAGWSKVGRESGADYLSLKVGNTRQAPEGSDAAPQWELGPFYGRLFRETTSTRQGDRVRYFGFVEHSERIGEDQNLRGIYKTHWQLTIRAKRATSADGRTTYVSGTIAPAQGREEGQDDLPF